MCDEKVNRAGNQRGIGRSVGLACLLAVSFVSARTGAAPAGKEIPRSSLGLPANETWSIHRYDLELHRGEMGGTLGPVPSGLHKDKAVEWIVFGYYPYWVHDMSEFQWDLLTHVAWFAIEIGSDGTATSTHGWPDQTVLDAAHASETKAHLSFTLFSQSGIAALCGSASNRARAIETMITQMQAGGADGISIDFETPGTESRDDFVTFVSELRAELDARGLTDAEISIAGTAWSGLSAMDVDALLDYADIYFIMGYPYFGSWSNRAGPVGKARTRGAWASFHTLSAARTIGAYTKLLTDPGKRRQIVYGVPYYGWHWGTADDQPGSSVTSAEGSVIYRGAADAVSGGGRTRLWDEDVMAPYYVWQQSGWQQVWYDDVESLGYKYEMILDHDLGGVGIWALGYDNGGTELWDLLRTSLGAPMQPQPGDRFDPIRIDSFPFSDSRDTSQGPSNYFDYYSCSPDLAEYGREWVYRLDLCQPGHLSATVPRYQDQDPDLHLLSAPDQGACLARDDTDLEMDLQPGMYLLVVDTWVDSHDVQREGPYDLTVDFVPQAGTEPCPEGLVCDSGSCVCPDDLTDCDGVCVDTDSDPAHCGDCTTQCESGQTCEQGRCMGAQGEDDAAGLDAGAADAGDGTELPCCPCPDEGCSCRSSGFGGSAWPVFLLGMALWSWSLRRRDPGRRRRR